MKKRVFTLVACLVVSGLVLTACGPKPAEAPALTAVPTEASTTILAADPTEEPTEEPTQEPTEESVVTLTIWADDTRAPILSRIGQEFTAQYGVNVVVEMQSELGDIRDQLRTAGPAGEGPDIIVGPNDWLGQLVSNGLLASIDLDLSGKKDQFLEAALQAFTAEGKLYGMPYATENVAFVRNTDFVPEAPETWDEVREIAAQLEGEGKVQQGYVIQSGPGDTYHFFPILTAFGGSIFGLDAEGNYNPDDVRLDSAGSLAAAEWLDTMVKEGHLQASVDWDTMHAMFGNRQAAMFITGPWSLSQIKESGVPYAISNLPAGPAGAGQPFLGVQAFMVSAFSHDIVLAQTFLTEFVATKEVILELYQDGQRPPAFLPALEEVTDPDMVAFGEAGRNGIPMPSFAAMSNVWSACNDALTLISNQQAQPVETFTNAATQVRTAMTVGQ